MKKLPLILICMVLVGCTNGKRTNGDIPRSTESVTMEYGYSPENPIRVGDGDATNGPMNERIFLSSLRGPNGEKVSFNRLGSCCEFETPNGFLGGGLLDMYEVNYDGLAEPKILYLNMYDPGEIKPPRGFILY